MAELSRHGSDVGSVFDLLGEDENDLTSALGFVLARSPRFREAIIHRVSPAGDLHTGGETNVPLEVRGEKGRTDLELHLGEALFVFEAKRNGLLPSEDQRWTTCSKFSCRGSGSVGHALLAPSVIERRAPASTTHSGTEGSGVSAIGVSLSPPWYRGNYSEFASFLKNCRE